MFKTGTGDWTQYRELPSHVLVDFHDSDRGRREASYWDAMSAVYEKALTAIMNAYEQGKEFVILTHGSSTSRPGKMTARSQVRGLMRSSDATPYIIRRECIQHESVFVAAIRPKPEKKE